MINIVLLGAPGSGKGTLAKKLCPEYGLKHVSTGDLLRDVVASGSTLGQEINSYITKGELVPDALIGQMIKEVLNSADAKKGVLLDGFPRTIPQADMLTQIMSELHTKITKVFYMRVELPLIISRLVNRVSCKTCGRPYHLINVPPKKAGICDDCGGTLIQREDDKEDTIRSRYETYLKKTQPLIDYYKKTGSLIEIDGAEGVDKCLLEVRPFLK